MQVILEPYPASDANSPVVVETTSKSTVTTLISSYCSLKDEPFSPNWVIIDDKERPLPQYSTLASLGIVDGQKLRICQRKQSFFSRDKWPFLIALAALIICVAGILIISMVYGLYGGDYPDDYGVVMDAGSSKTNTIVYSWKSNKHQGTGCVTQRGNCFAEGGVAEMDPMKLDPVINCAKEVTKIVDPDIRYKTPLFFAATAGMRLLNITDPDRVDKIMEQLQLNLTKTGLSVRDIEIISGQDEGFYGWITSNFLQQTLEIPQIENPWVPTTYGALDMGGASMQIAYALPKEEMKDSPDFKPITLYGQTHNLFSYSNLCFGRTEAEWRYRSFLVKNVAMTNIEDPCSPEDYKYNLTGADLFTRPCTQSTRFSEEFQRDPSILDKNFTFSGTSKPNYCRGNVSQLLDNEFCRKWKFSECFRSADNIPNDQKYLAFASYFYTTDFLNATRSSYDQYLDAVEKLCLKKKAEIEKITKKMFGKQHCFNGQYIHEALTKGFGFKKETWGNIEFVGKISGKDVGWPLGYMINATNILPTKAKTPRLISATALTVCLILFIIVVIGAVIYILKNKRKTKSNYGLA